MDTGIQGYKVYGIYRNTGYTEYTGYRVYRVDGIYRIQGIPNIQDTGIQGRRDIQDTGYTEYTGYRDTARDTKKQGYRDNLIKTIRKTGF